jgi:hypothetical protein
VSSTSLRKRGFVISLGQMGSSSLKNSCIPMETWFPKANGLKFLVETWLLGQMHQSFRRKCGCMGQMGPSSLGKHVGNMSPKEHVFPRNFNPFVSGNHISLRNLNPFALGKLQVLSPRGSWGNLVKSLSACKLQLPFSLGKLA